MSAEDFSDDTTGVNFGIGGMDNHDLGDDMMGNGGDGNLVSNDDSMGAGSGDGQQNNGSNDTGSADQYGKDDDRKLFIGGLSWETTEKDLRDYFAKYGGIESLTLKTDPTTGRSRGFAFIVFNDGVTLDKVIAAGEHVINGKKVDPKKAKARHGKIFVGGLTQEISDDEIRNYFAQFGNVVEIEMPIDKTKNQRKGFCFVTFDNEQIVLDLLKNPKQTICGKEVDVKKAQPSQNSRGMMGWSPMGMGGRGGGRGAPRGRGRGGGRGDWSWGGNSYGSGYGSYNQGGYGGGYDYYSGGGYGAYDAYGGYGSYGGGYDGGSYSSSSGGGGGGYGGGEYDTSASRGSSRGRGYAGKQRGAPRGQQRHVPY